LLNHFSDRRLNAVTVTHVADRFLAATHSMSINEGLDQEMPGGSFMGATLLDAVKTGTVKMSKIDDSVSRILTQMYKFGLFDHMSQWNGTAHGADVTSLANSQLARNISAQATVLLKNNGVLPLKPGKKVVLIGADATTPFVHGGGSGSVQPTYTVSPLTAIQQRNGGKIPKSGPGALKPTKCTVLDKDTDYFSLAGSSNQPMKEHSVTGCCDACGAATGYNYFTYTGKACWCHKEVGKKNSHEGYTSGSCHTVAPPGPPSGSNGVTTATGDAAAAAAAAADVAVVFIHTTSSEGSDRKSLSFEAADDAMVAAVAKAQKNTVVVMVNPGAVLTPWADDVAAALTMFMPGLEMGNAISDVLYGDINPSGRLALTFPNKENEVGFTKEQWPGVPVSTGLESTYTEKLEVGYRWYDSHKVEPKYAFGHGLSYTNFSYSGLKVSGTDVSVTVKNVGATHGAEVAQLYLGFPPSAGEPPQVLRGFQKLHLAPGSEATATFELGAGVSKQATCMHVHLFLPVSIESDD
jgi:beta-glucosidase